MSPITLPVMTMGLGKAWRGLGQRKGDLGFKMSLSATSMLLSNPISIAVCILPSSHASPGWWLGERQSPEAQRGGPTRCGPKQLHLVPRGLF